MQFILTGYDGADAGALDRRMAVREEHLKKIEILKKSGEFLFGGAILDEEGKMIGSVIVYEFPDRQSLDEKLKEEPYIINGVWKKIEIHPFRLAKHN
jgi:uncharacterized protein YciI